MFIKLKKGVFHVNAEKFGGKRRRFETRIEAETYLLKNREAHLTDKEWLDPATSPTFEQAMVSYVKSQQARVARKECGVSYVRRQTSTLRQVANLGSPRMGGRKVATLTSAYLLEIQDTLRLTTKAHKTLRNKWGHVVAFFDWLDRTDRIDQNFAKHRLHRRGTKPVVRLSHDLIAQIIANADAKYKLPIMFAAFTGLRAGEQRPLLWEDLDFTKQKIYVRRAVKDDGIIDEPKTARGIRSVPLTGPLASVMRQWKIKQPIAQRVNGLVFPDDFGNVQNNNNWRRLGFYPACKKAGIDRLKTKKPIVWHDLRHYYASTLLFDLKPGEALVAKYMGHHSATFTADTYGHWLEDDKQEEAMCDEMSIIHEKVIGLGRAGQ